MAITNEKELNEALQNGIDSIEIEAICASYARFAIFFKICTNLKNYEFQNLATKSHQRFINTSFCVNRFTFL